MNDPYLNHYFAVEDEDGLASLALPTSLFSILFSSQDLACILGWVIFLRCSASWPHHPNHSEVEASPSRILPRST